MKRMGSAKGNSKSSGSSVKVRSRAQTRGKSFAVCTRNDGYAASLETRKIYPVIPDSELPAEMIRVVDESGEDYLYPASWFEPIRLNVRLREALKLAL